MKPNPYLQNIGFYGGQMAIRVVSLALGLVLNRWIVTYVSVSEYASYSVIFDSVLPLVFVFISFSLPVLLQKFYTLDTSTNSSIRGDIWTTLFGFRIATGFLGLGLVVLVWLGIQYIDELSSVLLGRTIEVSSVLQNLDLSLMILLFLVQFVVVVDWSYRAVCDALGRTWQFGLTDLFGKMSMVVILYGCVVSGITLSVFQYAWILLAGYIMALLMDMWWQRGVIRWGRFDWALIRFNLKPMLILSLSGGITYVYLFSFQMNLSVLGIEAYDLATFSNAYNRIFLTFVSIPAIIMPHIATRITQYLGSENYRKARILIWAVALFGFLYAIMYLIGSWVVLEILDPQAMYPETQPYIIWLSLAMIWYPLIQVLGPVFIFFHKEKYEFAVAFILALIGIATQYYGIVTWGIAGAIGAIILITMLDAFLKIMLYLRIIQYLPKHNS